MTEINVTSFEVENKCPNCGSDIETYSDMAPFEYFVMTCLHCGFNTTTSSDFCTLKALNEKRKEFDLEPIKKLPSRNIGLIVEGIYL
jgi:predicted RNA-binding Zn-ribbon protein involved in translation (DUF1610 family)